MIDLLNFNVFQDPALVINIILRYKRFLGRNSLAYLVRARKVIELYSAETMGQCNKTFYHGNLLSFYSIKIFLC